MFVCRGWHLNSLPDKNLLSHANNSYLNQNKNSFQFWSAYAPCSSQHLDSVQLTLEQIDLIRRLVLLYPQHMTLVTTADGIEKSHKDGKLASLIGVEGGHSIGTSLAVLRMFYQLGARYLTLTHTCNTPWADCCKVDEPGQVPHIGGLSHFGTVSFRASVKFHFVNFFCFTVSRY